MDFTFSIVQKVENFIQSERMSMSKFANEAGINTGIISSILNGTRVLSLKQLDKITVAMNEPPGSLYDQYTEEYLLKIAPDWRRIRTFILRCTELNRLKEIGKAINFLSEHLLYSPACFELAEQLYDRKNIEAAMMLYENVANNEKKQHSERLAICQYRLFMIRQNEDQEENYQLAIKFEPYVERLDEAEQLEALKDLSKAYQAMRRWDKVEQVVRVLKTKALTHYYSEYKDTTIRWKLPLFVYVLHSYLLLCGVYEERQDYTQALTYSEKSRDTSWIHESDSVSEEWKRKFERWAEVNSYVAQIFSGDFSVMNDYKSYALQNKNEVSLFLLNIIEAANKFCWDIDSVLNEFDNYIKGLDTHIDNITVYTIQLNQERYTRLLHELAKYNLNRGEIEKGTRHLLLSLEKAYILNYKNYIIKNMGLFEKVRVKVNFNLKRTYQIIIEEVYANELV
ncbi:transcriptional regulator [Paenibacillus sp. WLX2291]|uniref:transcriptional regulator n=1 Tax=Paenibacillus sp. WLX2291 TaxID=3296934 RepID=UPI0039841728